MNTPPLHKTFNVGDKVHFEIEATSGTGTIGGIATRSLIRLYIVILDEPLDIEGYENWKAVVLHAMHLRTIQ